MVGATWALRWYTGTAMKLSVGAQIEIPKPPEQVFDLAVSCDGLVQILRPVGVIPGVAKAEMNGGAKPATGARRSVTMTDRSTMDEEIILFERPSRHVYRWANRPALPFSLLVRSGEGDWTFSPSGSGTRVDWLYTFELTTPLVRPLAALVLSAFQKWMARGLETLSAKLVG